MKKRLILRVFIVIASCVLSFFAGVLGYYLIYTIATSSGNVHALRRGSRKELIDDILYLFTFTILPVLILCFWKFTPVYSLRRKFLSVFITLGCIAVAISLRTALVVRDVRLRRDEFMRNNPDNFRFPAPHLYLEQLNLWIYLCIAVLAAAGLIYLLLREHKQEHIEFSFEPHLNPGDH